MQRPIRRTNPNDLVSKAIGPKHAIVNNPLDPAARPIAAGAMTLTELIARSGFIQGALRVRPFV
jgi:hypothetical protein